MGDVKVAARVLKSAAGAYVLGDTAYGADHFRTFLTDRCSVSVIKRQNRTRLPHDAPSRQAQWDQLR